MPDSATTKPQVSIILPVRDEEANITGAVESLAVQTIPAEIIVVNDGSTDRTGEILRELAARFLQLRMIENRELPAGWVGKNYACHLGAQQAKGQWLLFTDADVRHRPEALAAGLELARSAGADLISFSPGQEIETWWERAVIPFVFCRLAQQYNYERINDPSLPDAAANGQWLLISRKAYNAVGGHAAVRGVILEDVALARCVKRAGYRLHFASGEGQVRTRMYRRWREMREGWSKNLFPLFGYRKAAVAAAVALTAFNTLAVGVLILGWMVSSWLSFAGFVYLAWRHAGYAGALRRNRFPLPCIVLYWPGSVLFAWLMVLSSSYYLRGRPVAWKGRIYTGTAAAATDTVTKK